MKLADYRKDFLLDPSQAWLNVASEGPIPNVANEALQQVVKLKLSPHLLTIPKFQSVPLELKKAIARLIGANPEDVILGNSATYGLHLLANGLEFKEGDEIVLLQNDFPTDILPWLSLEARGIIVHQLKPREFILTPEEIKKAINPRTKLICLPLVHSFSGYRQDIKAIGQLCRGHGILLVVNLSQAAGAFEIDLKEWDVDALVCAGYKWLLGPYGTGFCWIKKEVRERLNYPQNYWISLMDEKSLSTDNEITLKDDHSARRYDVFGTANFFNYVPWTASIEYLLSIGLDKVRQHNQILVKAIIEGINPKVFHLISPQPEEQRSNIVVFSHQDSSKNTDLNEFLKNNGYHLALWKNKLRISPHIYNTQEQIEGLLGIIDRYGTK